MNINQITKILETDSGMAYAQLTSMIMASKRRYESKYTLEEREIHKIKRELERKEDIRRSHIHSGECPSCKGKLLRGKKNKKMEYKREWKCESCLEVHYL